MAHHTFQFHAPVAPEPNKVMEAMRNVLHVLNVPVRVRYYATPEEIPLFDKELGFHVGVPATDTSFHSLESFFTYICQQKLWEEK